MAVSSFIGAPGSPTPWSPDAKLYQAVLCCTKLYQALLNSTKLYQALPYSTKLYQTLFYSTNYIRLNGLKYVVEFYILQFLTVE